MPASFKGFKEELTKALDQFSHFLPGQAPIKDFVHHNSLHGYEHLPFPEALRSFCELTGAFGYLPISEFRKLNKAGRITESDLKQVVDQSIEDVVLCDLSQYKITKRQLILCALQHDLLPTDIHSFSWKVEEKNLLKRIHDDVPKEARKRLLSEAVSEEDALERRWRACIDVLMLDTDFYHPEDIADHTPEMTSQLLDELARFEVSESAANPLDEVLYKESIKLQKALFSQIGEKLTMRGFLMKMTGHDLLEDYRAHLLGHMASYLDQGMASWHNINNDKGFYYAWRSSAFEDLVGHDRELPDWHDELELLPEEPFDAIVVELRHIGLPESQWLGYLKRLALELPGWSGIFMWYHQNKDYKDLNAKVSILDYLAVRLVLERLFANRLTRRLWNIEANFTTLRWYQNHHKSEFYVRWQLINQSLPEFLTNRAQRLSENLADENTDLAQWQQLAHLIWIWRLRTTPEHDGQYRVYDQGWRLFRLAQILGLTETDISELSSDDLQALFEHLELFDEQQLGFIWLKAYENHYRDQILHALANNPDRQYWKAHPKQKDAQIVFCMDEREEGIRRHLEVINPNIETLGAAAFFNIVMNWKGLDDESPSALCPVVVTPVHQVSEVAAPTSQQAFHQHRKRRRLRLVIKDLLHHEVRRNLLSSTAIILLGAPVALFSLIGKLVLPLKTGRLVEKLRERIDLIVKTDVEFTSTKEQPAGTYQQPRMGFDDTEQADRVYGFLQNNGMIEDFAPLVILMGHGSTSENNPHRAAYDCGACSGRHSGPNARVFAQMANRPEVRALLNEKGLNISPSCWFIGASHNTCNESILWFDEHLIPDELNSLFEQIKEQLTRASKKSAHERCRKFASASPVLSQDKALEHVARRSCDFSQARPELGHATNACAFIGRRALTRGLFFDRRMFLISYNTQTDPSGEILERLLLSAGPVGAGISLEYYFSTVNNSYFGAGSKITHNTTGFFAVMEGSSSDLRTGLPTQMIEVHEAIRLQVIIDAPVETVKAIYQRQPALQALIGNGWLLVSVMDPETDEIQIFNPDAGFIPWQKSEDTLQEVLEYQDWYQGKMEPLIPVVKRALADV